MEIEAISALGVANVYNMYFTTERVMDNYYIKCESGLYDTNKVASILGTEAAFVQQSLDILAIFFADTPLFSSSAELLLQLNSCFEELKIFIDFARQALAEDTAENRAAFEQKSTAMFTFIETRLGQYRRKQPF
jgi:hypothetical protein